jgi:subtilisin-like proprotein convertase family protein
MKTKPLIIGNFTLETAATQRRIENVPLRATTKPNSNNTMKKIKTIILLVLLAAVSPLLLQAQTLESFNFTTNRLVPDGDLSGMSDVRNVTSAVGNISSLTVHLKVTGEFNGDLYAYLRHTNGFVVLLNRVGKTASDTYGYGDSGFDVTFQSGAPNGDMHVYQNVLTPAAGSPLTGIWDVDGRTNDPMAVTDLSARTTSLTNFNGLNGAGEWTLYLADVESGGTNLLTEWSLDISGAASPTLTWTNPADITYGTALSGTQLNATATYNSTNVPGTLTYSSPAGTYLNAASNQTLSVTFTPADANSFLPVSTSVALNVSPAPLTITANDANMFYGTTLPVFTASYSGFVNGDTAGNLATQVVLGTTATSASPVGSYAITATGTTSSNYTITQVNGTLIVNPAALIITANGANKVYGAALPTLTASYNGFVNGDTASSLGTPVTLGTPATASSMVGVYPITASGAVGANYSISYAAGILTVTTAPLTITANDTNKVYGAALPTLTASYNGFVNGDTASSLTTPVTLGIAATASSPAGLYTITASGAADTNYSIDFVNGTLTVGTAIITVTADNKTKAYGQALPELTASYSGFVNSDTTNSLTALATLATTATPVSNVGVYPITASSAVSTNYTFNYIGGSLTITQALSAGLVTSSANPALPGVNVIFTMAANAVTPGAGTPTGTINFRIDGSIAGSGTLAGGLATFTINSLAHGSHAVAAEYAGDVNFAGTTNLLAQSEVINTPPVAGNVTLYRNPVLSVKVLFSTLLTNVSDADGDTLNISISSTSASNATVTVSGGWVFYTPPAGFSNADSFTYTVTDGHGGSATGTVAVAIQVDNSKSQNLTITDLGNGSFLINGDGIPDYTYRLQSSDTITPYTWQDIVGGSTTADSKGKFSYTDTSVVGMRFYRTVYP